jgi:Xaa-Pro aminopeptidase
MDVNWDRLRKDRMNRIDESMKKHHVDCLVVNSLDNVRYVTDYRSTYGYSYANVYIGIKPIDQQPLLVAPALDLPDIRRDYPWIQDAVPTRGAVLGSQADAVASVLSKHKLVTGNIALCPNMHFPVADALRAKLPRAQIVNGYDVIMDAKKIKTRDEINEMDRVISIGEISMEAALDAVRPGKTERNVMAVGAAAAFSAGADFVPWEPETDSGINLAWHKRMFTDRRLRNGDMMLIDQGAILDGYNCEFTRMKVAGQPSKRQKELYTCCYNAHVAEIEAIAPGKKCSDVHEAAANKFEEQGFSDYERVYNMQVLSGHGIGTSVYESPEIGPGASDIFEPGMILAIEPSLFKPGEYFFRLEDHVLVTEDGRRVLTKTRYEQELLQ